jgi:hypothetical protein
MHTMKKGSTPILNTMTPESFIYLSVLMYVCVYSGLFLHLPIFCTKDCYNVLILKLHINQKSSMFFLLFKTIWTILHHLHLHKMTHK